jgi:D-alanyl-D-alanine carboxypeptidase/D-alanyl-D-alanine-endopeptidase (penicillin-binding protein 4)
VSRVVALTAGLALLAPAPAGAATVATRIARAVRASHLAAITSVTVRTTTGETVYGLRESAARTPASNEKLLTSVAVLDALGPDARLTTTVVSVPPVDGVIDGAVYLVGGGDPTLSRDDLRRLARALHRSGVRSVRGGVTGDGTRFDTVRGVATWKPGFLPAEAPPMSALTVDRNTFHGAPVWQPERRAASLFRAALRHVGVRVTGRVHAGAAPTTATVRARVTSAPVARLLRAVGKDSDNFTAEMLLKAVAAARHGRGTTALGVRDVHSLLEGAGLDLSGIRTVDGSGLSYGNRVTTAFLASLLATALADPAIGRALDEELPVAGIDGTLRLRLRTGPAHGAVRAKTGTLDIASSLTGHVGRYVFSVISSTPRTPIDVARARWLQDRIAQVLARG